MMLIVALTGAVGFLASFALLHAGVKSMWLRYPSAVLVSYGAFLFLLWCWLRLRRDGLFNGIDAPFDGPGFGSSGGEWRLPDEPWAGGGGQSGGGGASASFGEGPGAGHVASEVTPAPVGGSSAVPDATGILDLDDLTVVIVAVLAVLGAACAAFWIVWVAPALLAELILDAALATGLYRRLRGVKGDHWLRTAVRRTGWAFMSVALLFALAGGLMQLYAPGAQSIGQVIQHQPDRGQGGS